MLQRIQTVYLLIALILSILMIFFPLLEINHDMIDYQLRFRGLVEVAEKGNTLVQIHVFLSAIMVIIPFLTLLTIYAFKHRIVQIRVAIFNAALMLGYYALYFLIRHTIIQQFPGAATHITWPIIIPAINVILTILAIIAISKDEVLVRSLNRLR